MFTENGYQKNYLEKIANDVLNSSRLTSRDAPMAESSNEPKQRITLPWIPKISPKLRSVYKKAGFDVAFKSGKSLGAISS